MKIDTDHLHYWMQAIRQSQDPTRTLDAFWSGQIKSKEWLIENLKPFIDSPVTMDIHGGWVGVLASLIFQSNNNVTHINSIDIDPSCEPISTMMNKGEEIQGRFTAITADMCEFNTVADVVINTSCEHITQDQYNHWLSKIPSTTLIVLQSNNYEIPEHVRTAENLEDFKNQSCIDVLWAGELNLPLYTRYMLVGKKQTSSMLL